MLNKSTSMPTMLLRSSPELMRGARLALILISTGVAARAGAADTPPAPAKASIPATLSSAKSHPGSSPYAPDRFAGRAGLYYRLTWGIDSISVRLVESGELVRVTYRVLDPSKAQVLQLSVRGGFSGLQGGIGSHGMALGIGSTEMSLGDQERMAQLLYGISASGSASGR